MIWIPVVLLFGVGAARDEAAWVPRNEAARIQNVANDLKERLALSGDIVVELVEANSRLVSVEVLKDRENTFLLSLEDAFVDTLTDEELEAVLAHELGHVWIFTHHPYLQTEQLATRIAMQGVSRDRLAAVYGKVWERNGTKGDLVRFLSP
jgi:hypothetical protein